MGAEQSKRNKICWNCFTSDGTQQECPSCNRHFHTQCLTRSEVAAKRTWICHMCTKLKSTEQTDKESDLKMLPVLVNGLKENELFEQMVKSLDEVEQSKAIRMLKLVLEVMKSGRKLPAYESFDAFTIDTNWILDQYQAIFNDDRTYAPVADLLKSVIQDEIDGLRKCGSCYGNAHANPENWFTMVCDEPHIIAWAKFQGCNFWPVKVMTVSGRKLSVRFFGDHTNADISAAKCYLFSEDSPAGKSVKSRGALYKTALAEARVYIENLRKKFGTFNYAALKTAIDPTLLAEYTLQMIPGTGILRKIDSNVLYDNDDDGGAEVSSSSNISTNATACGSNNTSTASTVSTVVLDELSANIDELHPSKKARLSIAADHMDLDQTNGNSTEDNQNFNDAMDLDETIANANVANGISPELFEQLRKANLYFEQKLNEMTAELNDKAFDNERLKHQNQLLVDENEDLKQRLNEKIQHINNIEAQQQREQQQQQPNIDRKAMIEFAKKTKICMACNTERPLDMLHFCGVGCQKVYLKKLED